MNRKELASIIDHTLLRPDATQDAIDTVCEEALEHGFACVCVNPVWAAYCAKRLKGGGVALSACVGFPLGANTARIKVAETKEAVDNGATEVDYVINIGALKSGFPDFLQREIAAVVRAAQSAAVKVIIETACLTDEEKTLACQLSAREGAAFVKTSTGYAKSGATPRDVALMRKAVGKRVGVKAAGGIRSYADAMKLVEAGATRLGTSSGVALLRDAPAEDS